MLTESCKMNDCKDGLQVYFATETQQYKYFSIYGHYELQSSNINGRPYFKYGIFGLWWNGIGMWWIGYDSDKGQSIGCAYYEQDIFCPSQLSETEWKLYDGHGGWILANNDLDVTCKCNFHSNHFNFISNM